MDAHNLFTASHHQSNEKCHWFIPGLAVANISNPLLLPYQSALILEVQYQLQQQYFCNISVLERDCHAQISRNCVTLASYLNSYLFYACYKQKDHNTLK